jgi:putative aldouronate transport system permease protein
VKGVELKVQRHLRANPKNHVLRSMRKKYDLYLFLAIPLIWYFLFRYYPIYGLQIAFKDFIPSKGIAGSEWAGVKYFEQFFSSYYFWTLIKNTITLSLYSLLVGFPIPIFLALLINEVKSNSYKKLLQNITYIPHFLSVVVIVGMLNIFLDDQFGLVNKLVVMFGGEAIEYMSKPEWFQSLYVFSNVWQNAGWNSIIYLAALAGIDNTQYEAATIDGASRIQKIIYISIPGILPTIMILLILQIGRIMDVGFEKVLLMQNPINAEKSEVIQTFVYRNGIQLGQFSYTTAVGLFNSAINFLILVLTNAIARRATKIGLW